MAEGHALNPEISNLLPVLPANILLWILYINHWLCILSIQFYVLA